MSTRTQFVPVALISLVAAAGTTIAAGVHDLFNTSPPVAYEAFTPTSDPTVCDFIGRFLYVRLTQAL